MTTTLTINKGNNIGQTIKDHLINNRLYKFINIRRIDLTRNKTDRSVKATVNYTHKTI